MRTLILISHITNVLKSVLVHLNTAVHLLLIKLGNYSSSTESSSNYCRCSCIMHFWVYAYICAWIRPWKWLHVLLKIKTPVAWPLKWPPPIRDQHLRWLLMGGPSVICVFFLTGRGIGTEMLKRVSAVGWDF